MAAVRTSPGDIALTLTEEERDRLLLLLEQTLRNKQIEEHRTDALEFKGHIQHEEAVIQGLIDKLRRP